MGRIQWTYLLFFVVFAKLNAQVSINSTGSVSAAALYIEAQRIPTTNFGGFLMPVVTEAQQALIPVSTIDASDDGLMVYVSDPITKKRCWDIYDGIAHVWRSINCQNIECAATILYQENFDSYVENTGVTGASSVNGDYPASVTKWTLTSFQAFGSSIPALPGMLIGPNDYALVKGGVLSFRDTNGAARFETEVIDISGYADIMISMDISESGTLEPETDHISDFQCTVTAADYVDIEYSTDGGINYTEVPNFSGLGNVNHTLLDDLTGTVNFSVSGISGSSLIVRIRLQNWEDSEYYFIDNIVVQCN